jgi:predicted ferric reductase
MEFSWKHAIAVVFNLVALVLLWQKRYHINYRDRIARLKREIMFSTIGRRPRGSTNKSYPAVGSVVVLLCGNIFSLVYRTHGKAQLAGRASRLALINFVVVLALGSGRNVIFNSWARFGYQELGVIHRWLARMFLLHAIVHIFCHATAHGRLNRSQGLVRTTPQTTLNGLTSLPQLVTSVGLLAITSFLYFRRQRWLYEVFKTSHAVLIVLLIVQTWFHILNKKNVTAIVLTAIISVLWLGTFILWAAFLQSRNGSLSGSPISSLERLEDRNDAKLYRVKIALSLQRTIAPGQYFYLVHRKWFFFQSHPYMVAWEEKEGDKQYVYFLVERRKGFSAWLQAQMPSKEPSKEPSVYMDGPYGGHIHLRNYDSVLFVSRGIGVASQILLIRDLLEAHDGKEARVRRVTLLWVDCDSELPSHLGII